MGQRQAGQCQEIRRALVFKEGMVTYRIQGDRRLKGEDGWVDNDAGTKGPIAAK
ncbi:hypothetical protein [Aeromonas caviae]|uniref:hypothetical protein n=1 Tax=Aeromonas caviae TaxID=648 RepID=UPI002E7C2038|nr:hypothetical protein [Aeromonas caviae]MEE1911294.1 hypothetical protein [Aeromonas caviae]